MKEKEGKEKRKVLVGNACGALGWAIYSRLRMFFFRKWYFFGFGGSLTLFSAKKSLTKTLIVESIQILLTNRGCSVFNIPETEGKILY